MQYKKFGGEYVLRLDAGEEIIETIKGFCIEEGIRAGKVSGIGGISLSYLLIYGLHRP